MHVHISDIYCNTEDNKINIIYYIYIIYISYTDKTLSLCVMIFVTPPRLGSLSTLSVLAAISA